MRLMRPCWSRSQRRSWRPFGWFRAPPTHVTDDDGDESLDTAAAMETKEGDDDDLGDDLDVDWSKKRRPRRKKKKKTKSAKQIKAMFKKRKARKKALEKQMRRLRALEDDGVFLECFQCFEEATKRKCCGGQLCDFCYDMSGACPACGVAVKDGKPLAEVDVEEPIDLSELDAEAAEAERQRRLKREITQELLECRICLNPGVRRKCCDGCVCDACYSKRPTCPVCGKDAAKRGLGNFSLDDPGMLPVLAGWCLTLFVVAAAIGAYVFVAHVAQRDIRTLHGFKCYGFFPRCDRLECVELHDRHDYAAPAGLGGDLNLTNIATWRRCNLDSVVKAVGSTCIFDFDLWAQSGKRLGYDFCVGTTAASQPRQVAGDEVRNAAFADGVYVFDDDFRSWPAGNASAFSANRRASGRWQSVFGGAVDAGCGGGVALRFSGARTREATTVPLDVRHGGQVSFALKLAPVGADRRECAGNYGSSVTLWYSVAGSVAWTPFATLEPYAYASPDFRWVSARIPDGGATPATRFKISQPSFLRGREHWAVGSINVFHRFARDWKAAAQWAGRGALDDDDVGTLLDAREDIRVAQCCYETDQCEARTSARRTVRDRWRRPTKVVDGRLYKASLRRHAAFRPACAPNCGGEKECCASGCPAVVNLTRRWDVVAATEKEDCDEVDRRADGCRAFDVPAERRANYAGVRPGKRPERRHAREKDANAKDRFLFVDQDARFFRRLNGAYLYVSIAGLFALYNVVYFLVKVYFVKGPLAFYDMVVPQWVNAAAAFLARACQCDFRLDAEDSDDEFDAYGDDDDDGDAAQKHVFELDVDVKWQLRFAAATVLPFFAFLALAAGVALTDWIDADPATGRPGPTVLYTPLHAFGGVVVFDFLWWVVPVGAVWVAPVPRFVVVALACVLDARPLYKVSKEVVCLLPHWVELVYVNTLPEVSALTVGSEDPKEAEVAVPLGAMEELSRFTRGQCVACALLYILACQPFALASLYVHFLRLPYDGVDRWAGGALGAVVCWRALCGPDVFVKAALAAGFLFSTVPDRRNLIGTAVCDERTKFIAGYSTLAALAITVPILCSDTSGHDRREGLEVLEGVAMVAAAAAVYGLFVGVVQGLPVTPAIRLTKVAGGHYVTYMRRTQCPCFHRFTECSTMHSRRQIVVLFVEDVTTFIGTLRGENVVAAA